MQSLSNPLDARLGSPAPIRLEDRPPRLSELDMRSRVRSNESELDMRSRVRSNEYDRELRRLQALLKEAALSYFAQGLRAVVVFEGSHSAGKSGVIRRMSWPLDPRILKVWPIAAPTEVEKGQHYLDRFWRRLPRPGQVVIFDRSWYGRVLVERVQEFATQAEWRRSYCEINEFERMLSVDGICLVKIYLHITPDEQMARFRSRFRDPLKRWKLTREDLRDRDRWSDYDEAADDMFRLTSTVANPWIVIPSNDKRYSRLAAIDAVVRCMAEGRELAPPGIDPAFEEELRATLAL